MPIWGEIELFCRAIDEEGRKETEKILAQAQAEADRIMAAFPANAQRLVPF